MTLRLTESDLDRHIAWKLAQPQPAECCTELGADADPARTPQQRASEFRRLLGICLLPFALVAAWYAVSVLAAEEQPAPMAQSQQEQEP